MEIIANKIFWFPGCGVISLMRNCERIFTRYIHISEKEGGPLNVYIINLTSIQLLGVNMARFDTTPRFIFVRGGFKLVLLNNCSFFLFSRFNMTTGVLWQEDGRWDGGGEVGKKA